VQPGDFVIADGSAVVFIAAGEISRVLGAAEQIATKEAAMAKALMAGAPLSEVMGGNYENMLRN
jgi:4-hydroxy-4-methyl-2-oxoglutarate aldolase